MLQNGRVRRSPLLHPCGAIMCRPLHAGTVLRVCTECAVNEALGGAKYVFCVLHLDSAAYTSMLQYGQLMTGYHRFASIHDTWRLGLRGSLVASRFDIGRQCCDGRNDH
jgi:hypothetical protein